MSGKRDMAVTTFHDFPLASRDREWDGAAAEKRVRAWADAKDQPNGKYRDAHIWYDAASKQNFTAYKLLFTALVVGTGRPAEQGELVILESGPEEARPRDQPIFDAVGTCTPAPTPTPTCAGGRRGSASGSRRARTSTCTSTTTGKRTPCATRTPSGPCSAADRPWPRPAMPRQRILSGCAATTHS
jgi:hypothetical protein